MPLLFVDHVEECCSRGCDAESEGIAFTNSGIRTS